jgi:branched-chain amino acid transport system ATP-binding protein
MLLEVKNLFSGYGNIEILKDVSFYLNEKETHIIFGLNGSGKTTLLKTLGGILKPTKGKIFLNGEEITNLLPRDRVKKGMLYVPEWGFFPDLTVLENIIISSSILYKYNKKNLNDILKFFPELKTKLNEKAETLSGGQRKMLILAMALSTHSKLLLFDEPSSGLSPFYVNEIIKIIKNLKTMGFTFLISEQNFKFLDIADKLIILDNGQIISEDIPEAIEKNKGLAEKILNL